MGSFFIRDFYLTLIDFDEIEVGKEFLEEKEDDILTAALAFFTEKKAVDYLSRAEQCRFGLSKKLIAKGFDKNAIEIALNYLESISYLSDLRFATAWLNNRKITHSEGRAKLASLLSAKGIDKNNAELALCTFFEQNDEKELCERAFKKALRLKKTDDKIQNYLIKQGFSYKLVAQVLEENV